MFKPAKTLLACIAMSCAAGAVQAAPAQRGLAAALAELLGGTPASPDTSGQQIGPKKPK